MSENVAVTSRSPQADQDASPAEPGQEQPPFEGISARPQPLSVVEDQRLATIAHMSGVAGCVPSILIHRWSKGRARFTEQESLEVANFSTGPTAVILVCILLAFIPYVGWIFGLAGMAAWVLLALSCLQGTVTVNRGRPYRYRWNHYLYDLLSARRAARRAQREQNEPIDATGSIATVPARVPEAEAQGDDAATGSRETPAAERKKGLLSRFTRSR